MFPWIFACGVKGKKRQRGRVDFSIPTLGNLTSPRASEIWVAPCSSWVQAWFSLLLIYCLPLCDNLLSLPQALRKTSGSPLATWVRLFYLFPFLSSCPQHIFSNSPVSNYRIKHGRKGSSFWSKNIWNCSVTIGLTPIPSPVALFLFFSNSSVLIFFKFP